MDVPAADALPRDRRQDPVRPPPDVVRADGGGNGAVEPSGAAGQPDGKGRRDQAGPERAVPLPRAVVERQRWAERLEKAENPVSSRAELRDRLSGFEPGHPSSPWDERGELRPPAPRLADLELADPPLSDAAYAAHVTDVVKGLDKARAAGLTTEHRYTVNPDLDIWVDSRAAIHDEIIEAVYADAAHVPCERMAVIAGGLGGAGKTTLLDQHPNINRSDYLAINPDSFKEELAKRGMVPEIPGFSPMEASSLAHEESSYLARQLSLKAMADGKNILWDITMSSPASTARRIDELRSSDYGQIHGVFVDIPIETSVDRMGERHRRGHDKFLGGQDLGGRYVPPEVIRSQADAQFGSANRRTFEELKGQFDSWDMYDNSVKGRAATLMESSSRQRMPDADWNINDDQ